jgi:DNA-binding response OmpR family regulator
MHNDIAELLKEVRAQGYKIVMPPAGRERVSRNLLLIEAARARFNLTPGEARILVALMKRDRVSKENLSAALGNPLTKRKVVEVLMCKLRKKLVPYGGQIGTIYKLGYQLINREKIRALIAEQKAQEGA